MCDATESDEFAMCDAMKREAGGVVRQKLFLGHFERHSHELMEDRTSWNPDKSLPIVGLLLDRTASQSYYERANSTDVVQTRPRRAHHYER